MNRIQYRRDMKVKKVEINDPPMEGIVQKNLHVWISS